MTSLPSLSPAKKFTPRRILFCPAAAKSSFDDTNQSRTLMSSSKGAFLVLDRNDALSPCSSCVVASRLAMLQFFAVVFRQAAAN